MATVVNFIDTTLQAAAARTVNLPTADIQLLPSAPLFKVGADGTITPAAITFTATQVDLDAALTFNAVGAPLTNVTANSVTVAGADMTGTSVTVIASATVNGRTYTKPCTITKVQDGVVGGRGPAGQRGTVDISAGTAGTAWSDAEATKAIADTGYGVPQMLDVVTLYNQAAGFANTRYWNGSAWNPVSQVINGSLLVKESVAADKIDARGLSIKDAQGNVILAAGSALPAAYAAPGTKNSDFSNGTLTIAGDNLVRNSSFERMTGGIADGWSIYNNDPTNEPASASADVGRNGGLAQVINWANSHYRQKGINGQICPGGWQPGKTYVISVWAKTTNLYTAVDMGIYWNTQPALTIELSNPAVSTSWQRYAWRITWGADVEHVGQGYISIGLGPGPGNVIFDDLMVAEGDVLTAYAPSTAEASTMASGLAMGPDGKLTGPGGAQGQATLPGMGQNVFRVAAMGGYGGGAIPVSPGLYKNGALAYGASLSYYVAMVRRSDGVIVQAVDFDVYGAGANTGGRDAGTMATFLNAYGPDHIAIIWTHDEPQSNRMLPALAAAMYRCGASRNVFGSSQFKYRSAYVLIGVPGCGEGNGKEGYQGDVANDPNAWVDMTVTLINGAFTVSSGYSPRTLADYGYSGDYDATKGAPAGTYVGGNLAEQVNLWAQQGANAWNAIPGVNTAISAKLQKDGTDTITGQISLQSTYALLVGTANDGIFYGSSGIYGRKGGYTTFSIGADGTATFAGSLLAASGSFGALNIAPGGFIAQGFYGTWDWGNKAAGPGFLIHPNGMLFGDYYDPNMGFVQIGADGSLQMPGFSYSGRQLTLTQPILISPNITNSFSASLSGGGITSSGPNAINKALGSRKVTPANGKAPYNISWSIAGDVASTANTVGIYMTGADSDTVSISATGSNIGLRAVVTANVTDASGFTAKASFVVTANFGAI